VGFDGPERLRPTKRQGSSIAFRSREMTRSRSEDLKLGWVQLNCGIQLSAAGAPLLKVGSPGLTGTSEDGGRYPIAGVMRKSSSNWMRDKPI